MKISEARTKITELEKTVERLKADRIKAEQEKTKGIGYALEREKQTKILRIIGHITAGRGNEAIQDLLEPMPVVISLDIRYADDKIRTDAEEETFARLKGSLIKAIEGTKIQREENGFSTR